MKNTVSKEINSLNNPEYKFLISLKKNRNRKKENKSIAEGFRENQNILNSELKIDTLYFCDEYFMGDNNDELLQKFENENVRIVRMSKKIFSQLSYRDRPDGFISLFDTVELSIPNKLNGPILIPDQIEKPGNLGTMIRTAKSFGINNIILSDKITDVFNPNVIRSSIGHVFTMNIFTGSQEKVFQNLVQNAYEILLLDPNGDQDLNECKPKQNFALVVGAEQYGISPSWFKKESTSLYIRSTNGVDSLNASTAAAIGMWELTK